MRARNVSSLCRHVAPTHFLHLIPPQVVVGLMKSVQTQTKHNLLMRIQTLEIDYVTDVYTLDVISKMLTSS